MNSLPEAIIINEESYTKIAERRQGGGIYRLADGVRDRILRLGMPAALDSEIAMADQLAAQGFPVSERFSDGMIDGMRYSIERFLGEDHYGNIFTHDTARDGKIADKSFLGFQEITSRFASAQLNFPLPTASFEDFSHEMQIDILCEEKPEWKECLLREALKAWQTISVYPTVLTHADYNPYNIYPDGVIDFETACHAPFGHDIVSAICSIGWFPSEEGYECGCRYEFLPSQVDSHYARFDQLCRERGLPPLSGARHAFEFFRGTWACARMHDVPRLQAWRYERFERIFLAK